MHIIRWLFSRRSGRSRSRNRVLYVQYSNPAVFPPLEHSSQILARSGWDVRFLGLTGTAEELKFPPNARIDIRSLAKEEPGIRQKLHYLKFTIWSLWQGIIWRPDWVYVSDIFAAPIGVALKGLLRRRTVYHEHDWPSGLGSRVVSAICHGARRRLVRTADTVIAPNAERARWLASEGKTDRAMSVVWNCPRLEEVGPPRAAFVLPLRLLYQGSINSERLPIALLEGMSRAGQRVNLLVVGYETSGSQGYWSEFRAAAERMGLADRVEFAGTVARSDLPRLRQSCHLGIAFVPERGTDRNFLAMTGASNKAFDYLAGGICPLVPDVSEWRSEFVEPGYALACDPENPDAIAELLDWCSSHPSECRSIGERGRQRLALDWNYETQFRSVLEMMTGDR